MDFDANVYGEFTPKFERCFVKGGDVSIKRIIEMSYLFLDSIGLKAILPDALSIRIVLPVCSSYNRMGRCTRLTMPDPTRDFSSL